MSISEISFEASKKARNDFFAPANTKGAGDYLDNKNVIKGVHYRVDSDPNIPKVDNFITNSAGSTLDNFKPYDTSSIKMNFDKPQLTPDGKFKFIWCPFGSAMVCGIIDNQKDYIDLWSKESKMFFRGDESHPDSYKSVTQRSRDFDFYTEGNIIFGFASLKDAYEYIAASNSKDEKKFVDSQILSFLGLPLRTNFNADANQTPAIGSSVVLDPIAYLGRVPIETVNRKSYDECVSVKQIVRYNKNIFTVVMFNIKMANIKRIRINKDNESLVKVFKYTNNFSENEYRAVIRNIITDVTPLEGHEQILMKEKQDGRTDYEGGGITVIKESAFEGEWMNKNETTEIPNIVFVPIGDTLDDEELLDKVIEMTDDVLNKEESNLAKDTEEMMATEHMDLVEIPEEEDLDEMDVKELEDIAVAGDEDLEEDDDDDTDYSDHIEESIDLPDVCKLKV